MSIVLSLASICSFKSCSASQILMLPPSPVAPATSLKYLAAPGTNSLCSKTLFRYRYKSHEIARHSCFCARPLHLPCSMYHQTRRAPSQPPALPLFEYGKPFQTAHASLSTSKENGIRPDFLPEMPGLSLSLGLGEPGTLSRRCVPTRRTLLIKCDTDVII